MWQVRASNSVILSNIRVLIQGAWVGKKKQISSEKTHNEGVLWDFERKVVKDRENESETVVLVYRSAGRWCSRLFAPGLQCRTLKTDLRRSRILQLELAFQNFLFFLETHRDSTGLTRAFE